jgi:RimJ/RimL family protein N-acetyltransferase
VGEATVYNFDYRGGASIAIRVLPNYHSRGIGSRTLKALIELAKQMDLHELRTEILIENVNSIKMTSKYMNEIMRDESKVLFALSIKN